jgi:hypothetical protein
MKPEHQKRLVQVLVEPGPEGKPFGVCTGFAITQSRVLTCAHVLRGASLLQVRFIDAAPAEWLGATQIWPIQSPHADPVAPTDAAVSKDLDVAILEVDPTVVAKLMGGPIEPALGYSSPKDRDEWWSRGMLRGASKVESAGRPTWEGIDFGGRLYRADSSGTMTLDADCSPSDPNDWQGGSGSPIIAAERLVAVLNSWPAAWAGEKLRATWVGHLWSLPDFCKAAGLETEGRRYDKLKSKIAIVLNHPENRPLRNALGTSLDLGDYEGNRLVDHLCGLNLEDLLRLGNHVYGELLDGLAASDLNVSLVLAEVLDRKVVSELMPWGTQPEVAARLVRTNQDKTMAYLALPCATMTVAELYLARLDERDARFCSELFDECVVGDLQVPQFQATKGFGEKPDDTIRQLLYHIGRANNVPVSNMTQTNLELMAAPVNEAIDKRANPGYGKPSVRPYLVFFLDSDAAPASRLAKLLPAMRVCRIDPNRFAEGEGGLCGLLGTFATLKSKREALQKHRKVSP